MRFVESRWLSPFCARRKLQIDAAQWLETLPDRLNEAARRPRLIEGQRLLENGACLGLDRPAVMGGTDTEAFLQAWIELTDIQCDFCERPSDVSIDVNRFNVSILSRRSEVVVAIMSDANSYSNRPSGGAGMPITGIGGVFFRAQDPAKLTAWYREHLGLPIDQYGQWHQESGPTVFAPFAADTDYFPADKGWMLNLRVQDLEPMLAALRASDIPVITKPEWDSPETGRFARVHDPEGNPVELWEPPAED